MHYRIDITINPVNQHLSARAEVTLSTKEYTDKVALLLHRDLAVGKCTGTGLKSYHFDRSVSPYSFADEAGVLTVEFDQSLLSPQVVTLNIEYEGKLDIITEWEVNRLTPELVELGVYAPWFPYIPNSSFTYDVSVCIDPGYQLLGTGTVIRTGTGKWRLTAGSPMISITLLAAPHFYQTRCQTSSTSINIYYIDPQAADGANLISSYASSCTSFFESCFGSSPGQNTLDIVIPRTTGGGYARPGLIVLELDPAQINEQSLFKYIAHETAHLWWHRAPSDCWEDWLNESLAEYSALEAVRYQLGEQHFRSLLAQKQQQAQNLPPVRGIERTSEHAYGVLYVKGCVLMYQLADRIGTKNINAVLRQLLDSEETNTPVFLALLRQVAGESTASWFNEQLSK